jgi:hypothetical protein
LKLIKLLNNFIFNKSILFNIIKKIKLFQNILTLNFNSIYSSQNNSLFRFSKIINLTSIISHNILNSTNQKFKNLKLDFLYIGNKVDLKLKKKILFKTLLNFQILKNTIIFEKLITLKDNNFKILIISNLLIKLNILSKSLTQINFNFYNDFNINYNKLLISNVKLKTLL